MKRKPNILWLTTDQQRFDTIHALGNEYIDTPSLDKLCREGVAFTNAYCQSPICTPSRASFLTGRYPSAINANINGASNLPEHCELITKRLSDAGYACGLIGKLHITSAWDDHEERMADGYSYFCYNLGPGHDLDGKSSQYAQWLRDQGIDWHTLFTNNGVVSYQWFRENAPVELRQTAWCAEKAIAFLERQTADTPWLLSVNCYDPHPPFDAPEAYVQKYLRRRLPDPIWNEHDIERGEALSQIYHQSRVQATNDAMRRQKASYYGMCEIVDMHYGLILDALERLGLKDDTIVLFHSDHGEMLGDHGLTHKGCRFYEGLTHVPLIISCPARFQSGIRYDGVTELTDIAPTLAQLCGVTLPDACGHSLLPVLTGTGVSGRTFARTEYYNTLDEGNQFGASNESGIENAQELGEAGKAHASYAEMYCDGRYKLSVYHGLAYGELYDLQNDPSEETNLWEDPAYQATKCSLLLQSYNVAARFSRPGQVRRGRY